MKTLRNLFSLLLTLTLLLCTASGAAAETTDDGFVDYVAQLKLNMSSATAKTSATVRTHVDGDTVHFDVPESVCADGVLKARFLALNTPESTGKIRNTALPRRISPRRSSLRQCPSSWNRILTAGSLTPLAAGCWSGCGISRRKARNTAT